MADTIDIVLSPVSDQNCIDILNVAIGSVPQPEPVAYEGVLTTQVKLSRQIEIAGKFTIFYQEDTTKFNLYVSGNGTVDENGVFSYDDSNVSKVLENYKLALDGGRRYISELPKAAAPKGQYSTFIKGLKTPEQIYDKLTLDAKLSCKEGEKPKIMPSEIKLRFDEDGATSGPATESHSITMHMAEKNTSKECDNIDDMPVALKHELEKINARPRMFTCRVPSPDSEFGTKVPLSAILKRAENGNRYVFYGKAYVNISYGYSSTYGRVLAFKWVDDITVFGVPENNGVGTKRKTMDTSMFTRLYGSRNVKSRNETDKVDESEED